MKFKLFTRVEGSSVKNTIDIFKVVARKDRKRLLKAVILIPIGSASVAVLAPLIFSLIIQALVNDSQNLTPIYFLLSIMVISGVITVIFNNIGYRSLFRHEEDATSRLTEMAASHLLMRSHTFFANHKVGSLTGDVITFVKSYMSILDTVFLQAMAIVVNMVASMIIIGILSPVLLLPLGSLTIIIILMSIKSLQRRAPYRNKRKKLSSQHNGTIADIIGNSLLVRVFARSHDELQTINHERNTIAKIAYKEIDIIENESQKRYIVLYVFQILTIVICIWLFTTNALTLAALIFSITYLGRITGSLFNLTGAIRTIEQAFLDASPISRIMQEPIEIKGAADAPDLRVDNGAISLSHVSFAYADNKDTPVFNNLSVSIPAGQRIGLAGHSGGGKTTFTQLLLRFADVDSGSINIDQQNIKEVSLESLYRSIAYVPQDPFLFHRSLRDNIAYGKPDASDEEIYEAARKANATEFIDKLPEGLNTVVGERGVKLSGGQRQRIAIARAILKDAPILVLDEATSALDSESEILIQSALDKLMKNRTSIVIAHRLSTIAKLDRILILGDGTILEDGNHQELLDKNGMYAKLWSHQSGGFLEEDANK
jgi:ATP-binding cassette subfamily B protein